MSRLLWQSSAAIVLLALGGAASAQAENPDGITLDEVKRRLTEWRTSFVNLRVVWDLRSLSETDEAVVDWPPPPDVDATPPFLGQEWIWADHGLDLLEERYYSDEPANKVEIAARRVEVFNGPKGVVFRAQYGNPTIAPPDKLLELHLFGLGSGKPTSALARTPMRGLYWPGTVQWLPELLAEWDWKLDGIDDVAGEPCARLTATQPYLTDVAFTEIVWLDLNHDCLVRRHRSPAVARRRAGRDFIVDEFQQIDDAIWFPKRGRIQLSGRGSELAPTPNTNQAFLVTDAAVNESLDLARFEPPKPAVGTIVADRGRPPYRYGDPGAPGGAAASTNASGQADRAAGSTAGAAPLTSAAPPKSKWVIWSAALGGASAVFLAVGFWFSHRK